jgi:hypothetical protein
VIVNSNEVSLVCVSVEDVDAATDSDTALPASLDSSYPAETSTFADTIPPETSTPVVTPKLNPRETVLVSSEPCSTVFSVPSELSTPVVTVCVNVVVSEPVVVSGE